MIRNMDFESYFRNKIESMLITASWVEQVHKMLGLECVSQVWGDKPEWYFWIDAAPGVYALVFEKGEIIESAGQSLMLGQFALKCYPHSGSDVFNNFSPQEQKTVACDWFDETRTPRLEARGNIPEAYFTVGSISLLLDAAETAAVFSFDSLDVLRWVVVNGVADLPEADDNSREKIVVRSLPGWRIGYPFFDCLIGLYAFYAKQFPAFCGATRSSGFECILDPSQALKSRRCDDSEQWSASVLFFAATDPAKQVELLWRAHLDSTEKIVFEHNMRCAAGKPTISNGNPQVAVNPLWRELAHTDLKSELGSTCGCCGHDYHC